MSKTRLNFGNRGLVLSRIILFNLHPITGSRRNSSMSFHVGPSETRCHSLHCLICLTIFLIISLYGRKKRRQVLRLRTVTHPSQAERTSIKQIINQKDFQLPRQMDTESEFWSDGRWVSLFQALR